MQDVIRERERERERERAEVSGTLSQQPRRKSYLDILKIIALFFVIYNHTGPYGWTWYGTCPQPFYISFYTNLFLHCICKIAVPLFLLISGVNLLGKEEPLRVLYKKRVLRMLILILLVSVANYFLNHFTLDNYSMTLPVFLRTAYNTTELCTYYLWLYLSFLLVLPLLRAICKSEKLCIYTVILYIAVNQVLPAFEQIVQIGGTNMRQYLGILEIWYVYPITGFLLSRRHITRRDLLILFALSLLSMWLFMGLEYRYLMTTGSINDYGRFAFFPSIFIFALAKNIEEKRPLRDKTAKLISVAASGVLGGFLTSSFIFWRLFSLLYNPLLNFFSTGRYIFSILVLVFLTMICGIVVTLLLKLIPGIKKLL